MLIRIGSRASTLAKIQSYLVGKALIESNSDIKIQYTFLESQGDKDLESPLWKISGQGIFTKELQDKLFSNEVDMIVHSWKDLDLLEREHTEVISVLKREDARDILLVKRNYLNSNMEKISIMTSSPRRGYNLTPFIRKYFPNPYSNLVTNFVSVRGNIQTRLRKFIESDNICIILAKAALDRLLSSKDLDTEICELKEIRSYIHSVLQKCLFMVLPLSENPSAPAQGAICVEIRKKDEKIRETLQTLIDIETQRNVSEERQILKKYGGGCHQKIGVSVLTSNQNKILSIKGETDQGEILKYIEINRSRQNKKEFILSQEFQNQKTLDKIHYDPSCQILWTNDLPIWETLAKEGIWVHGSNEGFGFDTTHIDKIMPNPRSLISIS
ncbi:MAG: hydroxymethylbilane synthase [Leptospira sp.]|nr:hydroxymethylbilane synthase [Leptospira sp.]